MVNDRDEQPVTPGPHLALCYTEERDSTHPNIDKDVLCAFIKWNTNNCFGGCVERKAFMEARLPADMSPNETTTVGADEMSVFYKAFLDKNWKIHLDYNMEWYRKNISLVFLAFRVNMFRVKQRLFS
uniref:Uncharacterized protein n=1 Tax=Timema douglasi TaxID=61478 RepID=A0A7R8VUE8_TIMDO|nr:unnamed protein product [Timema douglasi]